MATHPAGPSGSAYFSLYAFDDNADDLSASGLRLLAKDGAAPASEAPAWLSMSIVETTTLTTGGITQGRLHAVVAVDLEAAGLEAIGAYEAEITITDKSGPAPYPFAFEIGHEAILLDTFSGAAGDLAAHALDIAPDLGAGPVAYSGDTTVFVLDGAGALALPAGHTGPSRITVDTGLSDLTAVATVTFGALSGGASLLVRAQSGPPFTALELRIGAAAGTITLNEYTDDGTAPTLTELGSVEAPPALGSPIELALTCQGDTLSVLLEGETVLVATSSFSSGGTAVGLASEGEAHTYTRLAAA